MFSKISLLICASGLALIAGFLSLISPPRVTGCLSWESQFYFWRSGAALAQVPQGLGQGQVLDNMKEASVAMRDFYREHGNMPSTQADFDTVLKKLYSEELSGSNPVVKTEGPYRVLGDFRITQDQTVANIDPEMWRKNPPDRFNGMPANAVIILSDGLKTYAIWGAAFSGNPILDSNNRALIIYQKMADEPAK